MILMLIRKTNHFSVGTIEVIEMTVDGMVICPYCKNNIVRSEGVRCTEKIRSKTYVFTMYVCLECFQHFTVKTEKEE